MVLAGLALGGYVFAAWPDTSPRIVRLPYGEAMPKTPAAKSQRVVVRSTASVKTSEPELTEVAGQVNPRQLYYYDVSPSPLLDAVIAAPESVDVH